MVRKRTTQVRFRGARPSYRSGVAHAIPIDHNTAIHPIEEAVIIFYNVSSHLGREKGLSLSYSRDPFYPSPGTCNALKHQRSCEFDRTRNSFSGDFLSTCTPIETRGIRWESAKAARHRLSLQPLYKTHS